MGKPRKKSRKGTKKTGIRAPSDQAGKPSPGAAVDRNGKRGAKKEPFSARYPILRFVVLFAVCMGAFYALTITPFFEKHGWVPYLDLNAEVSGAVLDFFGQDVTVTGRSIRSSRASLQIERGCDAIHPTGLLISAMLASPTSVWTKLTGMVVGTIVLMITNLMRIISLFYIQIHFPNAFKIMHVEVWQAMFIFLALLCWVIWARWAVRGPMVQPDVSA